MTKRYLFGLILLLALAVACETAPATPPPATLRPTVTHTPFNAPTATPTPTFTPQPTLPPPPTPTQAPQSTPRPTPGPLNAPVPSVPKGGASCNDYPCFEEAAEWEARIRLPDGFAATYVALLDDQPTSLTFGPDRLLYVAQMNGTIWTVDADGNTALAFEGLNVPVATAFEPGTSKLYISDRVSNAEARIGYIDLATGVYTQLFDEIPCCYAGMHAANGIAFGPDGDGYVAIGAVADHGEILDTDIQAELHPWEASIMRFAPDGSTFEPYARGIRNAYDIAWDADGNLYATNNGPDYGPPDTFHRIVPGGEHGYPWYECDHCFGPAPEGVDIVPPAFEFDPHVAPTGVTAYLSDAFPGYYNNLFAVLWSAFEGAQKIVRFAPGAAAATDFATGFAAPIDVTVGPDGALWVADWATGIIFRIDYVGGTP